MVNALRLLARAARVISLLAAIHFLVPTPSMAARRPWPVARTAFVSPAPGAARNVSGPALWHVVDSAVDPAQRPAILRGSRSIWCGAYNPCWEVPVGYPDFRYEILFVDTGSHDDAYTLDVTMMASVELFYDHLYLIGGGGGDPDPVTNDLFLIDAIISTGSSGNSRLLVDWTGTLHADTPGATSIDTTPGPVTIFGNNVGQPDSLTTSITIASGHRALYFVFRSDELFSSEDGLWPFGSGALLDDLVTSDHGAIYTDAASAGGTDAFGGSVIVGTSEAPIVSSRKVYVANPPPSLAVPPDQTRTEGEVVSLTATATDPDPFVFGIRLSACGYPAGLTLAFSGANPRSATVSGTIPCGASAGSPYSILWSTTSLYHDVSATTVLTVVPDPHAPVVTAPATITRAVGSVVYFQALATDPDGDAIGSLTADLSDLPPGNNAAFSPEPGNHAAWFTWTPLSGDEGSYRVGYVASNALQGCAGTLINVVSGTTGVELDAPPSAAPTLHQNRPNPFNPQTSIRVNLPREARITLDVFDVQGRRVIGLLDRVLPAGSRDVSWDGRDARGREAPTGVYLYRMEGGGVSLTRRMVLLR